jgi:protein-tyrosine phosphatase
MPLENLLLHFNDGVKFIADAITKEETIFVHWYDLVFNHFNSNAGVSRSASFVIAYLIKEKEMNFDDAYAYV